MLSDKTLTCVECGSDFTFTVGEQEFFASRGFTNEPMNRAAVPNAVQLVGASREGPEGPEGPEVSAGEHEKCIQQFALSAVPILWFPLGRVATGRYTVVIASAQ